MKTSFTPKFQHSSFYNFHFSMSKFFSKLVVGLCFFILSAFSVNAQFSVTTNSGSGLAATYTSLANAITALNAATITAPVVITCPTGTETAPAGGYSITAQGTSTNTITIQGNGAANSIITAGVGTSTTTDAIFKLVGADYITLQGFTMQESGSNSTTTTQVEWGVALLHASTTNGAQNNTIQNNTITLNKTNLNTFGIYSNNNHSATVIGTTESVTNNTTGPANNNKIYNNTISNVNMGIAIIGTPTTANQDNGNDIGGSSSGTGNTISNWGGAAASSSYISNSGTSYCIYLNHQVGENVSYNTITSSTISGTAVTLRGIFKDYSTGATIVGTTGITNNTITITDNFTSGTLECIRTQGTVASTSTCNLNNNTILNTAMGGASSSTTVVGIVNSSAWGTLNMSNNIIRGTTSTATTGGFTGVSNTGAVVTTINMNSNQIGNASGNAITFSAATSGTVVAINNSGGAATAALTIQSNDIRGIVFNIASSSTHSTTTGFISNSAATLSQTISSNTFTNLNVNTTGSITFIYNSVTAPSGGFKTINSNSIVTAFNKGGAGGTLTLYSDGGSSTSTTAHQNNNNNFSNITVTGATIIAGWFNNDGTSSTPQKTITGNTFSNWTGGTSAITVLQSNFGGTASLSNNTISNITGQSSIVGLSQGSSGTITTLTLATNTITGLSSTGTGGSVTGIVSASTATTSNINSNIINTLSSTGVSSTVVAISSTGATPTLNINSNTINTLSGTGTTSPIANGISVSAGTTVNIYKNKIYDILESGAISTTSPAVNGIVLSGGTTVTTYNNIIGDLRATNATLSDAIRGISITSSTTSSTQNLFYNTIYLNASSSGTTFGTTGIFHTYNITGTTANLVMRNNIVVNTSTPGSSAGLTVAFRRSASTDLNNYSTSSNNNSFYAGTAATNKLIYYDGTNSDQTLAAFKARVTTRETNSLAENPTFTSTTGSNSGFLHISTSVYTLINNGAGIGTGIADDFDGDSRDASTPDIGADEFTGSCTPTQPTNLVLTPTGSNINGSFTASTTGAAGYLVVRTNTNSQPSPADGTTYSVGAGTGTLSGTYVESVNTSTSFVSSSGLTGGNTYYYWVFSFSTNCATTPTYNQTSALTNSAVAPTPCATPSAQPTSLVLTATSGSTVNGSFTAASPVPSGYLVVRSTTNSELAPVNGTTYTVGSATFGAGTYVEAFGTGLSFSSTGLTSGTTYYYFVYSYATGCAGEPKYLTATSSPAVAALSNSVTTTACPTTGTFTVGPTGNFTSITQIVNTLNAGCTLTGAVIFELQAAYNSSVETFPITFSAINGSSGTNTVTFRPATGATNLSITSSNATGILNLSGANYIIFDGRAGGVGTTKNLTIENTNNSTAYGVRLINGAANNTFQYCTIQNASTSSSIGALLFSTSSTIGNSNNTISNCSINALVNSALGNVCIYSGGSVGFENSNNTISNCDIQNYTFRGLDIASTGSNAWTITGNSFFNGTVSGALTYIANSSLHGLRISGGVGYSVINNFIGGSATGATSSNASYTATAGLLTFTGISISSATGTASDVKGNTIRGINVSCVPTAASQVVFYGILASGTGSVNIGGASLSDGNVIGSNTANSSIVITTTTGTSTFTSQVQGINNGGAGNLIRNNQVGGIDVNNVGAAPANGTVFGIASLGTSTTPPMLISDNIIGSSGGGAASSSIRFLSTTTATGSGVVGITHQVSANAVSITNNTIKNITNQSTTSSGTFTGVLVTSSVINAVIISGNTIDAVSSVTNASSSAGSYTGISVASTSTNTISSNTITNITQAGTGTSVNIRGIATSGGINSITSNSINTFSTASTATGVSTAASIIGVNQTSTTAGQTVSQNTIYSLSNTTSGATTVGVVGIVYTGPTTGTNLVARNFIHSLTASSTSVSTTLTGIYVSAGLTNYQNNMVRLGTLNTAVGYIINGINDAAGTNNYYFNSIYIGGSNVATGGSTTVAFRSAVTTNTRAFQNNIFFNARSNAAGTAKHYAVTVAGTSANPTGLTINYNDYYVNGTGGVLGLFNSADVTDLAAWRTAVGQDANSKSGDPQFITPDGTAATVNLHINASNPTPIEGTGLAIGGITDDFDGETRASFTPTDMGADAGNFTVSVTNDIAAVSFVSPINGGTQVQNIAFTPQASFINNGTATQTSVTVRYKIIDGSSTVVYNQTATISSLAAGISTTVSFPSATVTGTGAYTIQAIAELAGDGTTSNDQINGSITLLAQLAGDYLVGSGQSAPYNTITNAVAQLNTVGVSAAVRFLLTDASYSGSETFPITINSINGASATNTFTIRPNTSVTATISGSSTTSIFKINGASYVTIDGSNSGGTDKSLNITNTSTATSTAVIWQASLGSATTTNTYKNCNITAGSNTVTSTFGVFVGGTTISTSGTGADNDNVTIQNNTILTAYYGIYASGTASASSGGLDVLSINSNTIGPVVSSSTTNIGFMGIQLGNAVSPSITSNTVQNISATVTGAAGIWLNTGANNATVTSNTIRSFVTSGTSTSGVYGAGIGLYVVATGATISRNNITGIENTSTSGYAARGIYINTGSASSSITLSNNFISDIIGYSDVVASYTYWPVGIYLDGSTGGINLYHNSVNLFGTHPGLTGITGSACLLVNTSVTALNIRDNIFRNSYDNSTSSTDVQYTIISLAANTAFTAINYNDYFAVSPAVLGRIASTDRLTLGDIQSGFGSNTNSINSTITFISNTDLHLTSANTALKAGTPISGITTDYDGDTRNVLTPAIGADEVLVANLWTGTTSTAYGTASNWDDSNVPSSGANITIPTGVTNNPVLSIDRTIGTLALGTGTSLSINGNTLTINGAVSGSGTLTGSSTSNLTIGGAIGTLNFTQTNATTRSLNNLNISANATLGNALEVGGTLNLTIGTLTNSTFLTMLDGAVVNRYEGTVSSNPIYGATTGVDVNYLGANTIASSSTSTPLLTPTSGKVKSLTINLSDNTKTVNTSTGSAISIYGNVAITSGTLALGNNLSLTGNWTRHGTNGTFTPGTKSVTFNGASSQSITITGGGVASFYDLTLNNSNGISLSNDATVTNSLTFTSGKITTGSNKVIISAGGSVSGGGTGWVIGNLQKNVATSGGAISRTFEIGGSSNYRPVILDFASVSTAGNIVASVSQSNATYSSLTGSGINATNNLQRYFTLTNSGTVFSNYDATFTFVAGDVVGTATNYVVRKYNGSWSAPVTSVATSTTTKGTGFTGFSDFAIGESESLTVATHPSNSTVCNASGSSFTSSSSSTPTPTVQWQENSGSGFANITDGGIYSGATTGTLSLSSVTNGMNGYTYRAVFSNINGSVNSNAATLTVNPNGTWTGAVSVNTSNAGNWCGGVPSSNSNIVIGASLNNPTLAGDLIVNNLTLQSSTTLSIGTNTLTVNGAMSGTGTLSGSSTSTLVIGGAAGTLNFTSGAQTLKDFSLNSSATASLGTALTIVGGSSPGTVILASGSTLTTSGNLTLQSDVDGTARVGNSSGTFSGNVNVQRYVPSRRAWRLLSAPLRGNGATTLNSAWQSNNGSGVLLFKPGGGSGFTAGGAAANIQKYTAGTGWAYLTNTDATNILDNDAGGTAAKNNAYAVFVTGPHGSSNITSGSALTTISTTGKIITGNQTFTVSGNSAHYNLIGNPYASPVDIDALRASNNNLANVFYVWDANLQTYGGYVTVTTDGSGSPIYSTNNGKSYRYVQSGQAFFLSSSVSTVTFSESHKTANDITTLFRGGATNSLSANISFRNPDNSWQLADGFNAIYDNSFSTDITDSYDAAKFGNSNETVSLIRSNKKMAIEARPLPTSNDTLFINQAAMRQFNYKFDFNPTNLNAAGLDAFLQDAYTNTQTQISLSNTSSYEFVVNTDAASSAANRFRIVFKPSTTLPVNITSIKATQKDNNVIVDWTVENEVNIKEYQVQKSTDGSNFDGLNTVKANNSKAYSSTDFTPVQGANYYRVMSIGDDGSKKYSNIVVVKMGGRNSIVSIYPNPIKGNTVNLQLQNIDKGDYEMQVINTWGQVLFSKLIQHNGGSATQSVQLPNNFAKGNYIMKLANQEKIIFTDKIIIE
jgi:hypothetical protein